MSQPIRLVALGGVDPEDVRWLARELPKTLGDHEFPIVQRALPKNLHLDPKRGQFRAEDALDNVDDSIAVARTLVLIDEDLCVPRLNFVFGVAQPAHHRAIVALPRLRESFYGRRDHRELFRARLLREAVHELGHTYGLEHCPRRECVMHFSNMLEDTDFKSAQFCVQHAIQFQSAAA